MQLHSPISEIKGVGDKLSIKFERLGIRTIEDLLNYFPRRYDDYSLISKISSLRPGPATIEIKVTQISGRYVRRGMHITEAIARDGSGSIRLIWFNQPYRLTSIKTDTDYFVSGNYELRYQRFSLINPSIELKSDFPINTARLVPKYSETKGLSSNEIRRLIKKVSPLINNLPENLPEAITSKYGLISLSSATSLIHFPNNSEQLAEAKRRFGFTELFELILASLLNKLAYKSDRSHTVEFNQKLAKEFVSKLAFKLTDDQRRAIWQVYLDMNKERPMNRLVEGDVGSGKTVVAAMAGLMVISQDRQVALMAPTELLARQHAETIYNLLRPLGLESTVCLLIGGLPLKQKQQAIKSIKEGKARFVIGTQALIQENIDMHNLSLVVIDEQHRFGVTQRKALSLKAKSQPHILSLSATPIPRSLALTLFGELDISRLVDKPTGRKKIETKLLSASEYGRLNAELKTRLKDGEQMFIVCPSIESEEGLLKHSVIKTYEQTLKQFSGFRVGLLHGKLKTEEKNSVLEKFINHELDILVSTTVIEVGIDIPNASIMVVMGSENFGLAQLHQLRGRVGRGPRAAHCYLVFEDNQSPGQRLRALESSSDGFKLAELDLELRGPGAIYGHSQHGVLDLRIAELSDTKLINEARAAAKYFVESDEDLLQYKQLSDRISNLRKLTNLN
jgi:ATP-dependent DNA helicase RecG